MSAQATNSHTATESPIATPKRDATLAERRRAV
jgi:hypothetical protein